MCTGCRPSPVCMSIHSCPAVATHGSAATRAFGPLRRSLDSRADSRLGRHGPDHPTPRSSDPGGSSHLSRCAPPVHSVKVHRLDQLAENGVPVDHAIALIFYSTTTIACTRQRTQEVTVAIEKDDLGGGAQQDEQCDVRFRRPSTRSRPRARRTPRKCSSATGALYRARPQGGQGRRVGPGRPRIGRERSWNMRPGRRTRASRSATSRHIYSEWAQQLRAGTCGSDPARPAASQPQRPLVASAALVAACVRRARR